MTYVENQQNLIINKMTKAQYDTALESGQVHENELYIVDEFGEHETCVTQELSSVSGNEITLVYNRTFYAKTISSNTNLTIATPPSEWDNSAVTFEIELTVSQNGLTISYPWTWLDERIAPDLSQAGIFTIAVRGRKRHGVWNWRANIEDTEEL